jgi:hypothetical protein
MSEISHHRLPRSVLLALAAVLLLALLAAPPALCRNSSDQHRQRLRHAAPGAINAQPGDTITFSPAVFLLLAQSRSTPLILAQPVPG